jgi:hypothetical protein
LHLAFLERILTHSNTQVFKYPSTQRTWTCIYLSLGFLGSFLTSYIRLGFKVSKVFSYELGTMNKLFVTSCFAKEDFDTLEHPSIQVHKRHELSSHERYVLQLCCMSFSFTLEVRGLSQRGLRSKLWSLDALWKVWVWWEVWKRFEFCILFQVILLLVKALSQVCCRSKVWGLSFIGNHILEL